MISFTLEELRLISMIVAVVSGFLALLFALFLTIRILRAPAGSKTMQDIAGAISEGALAYLNRQYRTLALFVVLIGIGLFALFSFTNVPQESIIATLVTFVIGAILSAIAGYAGMMISVRANVRTAEAAKTGLKPAFNIAFMGGTVTGMAVVGLGLLGVTVLFFVFDRDPRMLIGFGFGASLISLFARVGGGIYTKGADVGADLVGKVEKGIPEDDPRNPAVIADNVGDNVGDCAGMAADLFESYTVTLIAAMLLGLPFGPAGLLFPIALAGVAIVASIFGAIVVRVKNIKDIWPALNRGILVSSGLALIGAYLVAIQLFNQPQLFIAALIGVLVTVAISAITEYYTSTDHGPVRGIAISARTGPATTIISGLARGMESTLVPVIVIAAGIFGAFFFGNVSGDFTGGVYGIAIAALSMLSLSGIIVAVDAYGPITDNAGGIAQMSKLPKKVRGITDPLDAVGNTTKAVTKGFAIGSAGLAALSLFVAFGKEVGLEVVNLYDPVVVIGLLIGGLLPFIFGSMTMNAVGRAAFDMVEEVRRQFRTMKGIMSGKQKPDYARCVDISTKAALRELVGPGLLAVGAPLLVGFLLGAEALAGLLAGSIITGLLLAITMTTSGAAWDNAKKYIELGHEGGKGSDAHKAAVVGDTVGDPFKDTAGPAMNPLIKVLNTVSLLFASLIVAYGGIVFKVFS